VWMMLPPFPVTVNGYVPFATARVAVRVRMLDDPVAGLGEKLVVTPGGRLLIDIVTGELKPPVRATATV
jgi:hypothetical protein